MPFERSFSAAEAPMNLEEVHQLPVAPLPTPGPAPTPHLYPNSLELHIPIHIPAPPTPLPIIVAYPVSQNIYPANQEHWDPGHNVVRPDFDEARLSLEPVPAPLRRSGSSAPQSAVPEEIARDPTFLDNEFELIEVSEEELRRLESQGKEKTLNLFRALNVPVNIHKLRAMHARGKLPAPLLKLKYRTYGKLPKVPPAGGKENKETHLTSILKVCGATSGSSAEMDDAEPEPPLSEMETVQGESWYLPSATTRRILRRRIEHERSERLEHGGEYGRGGDYARGGDYTREREMRLGAGEPDEEPESAGSVIPNHFLLDQFPLPPSVLPTPQVLPHSVPQTPAQPIPQPIPQPLPQTYATPHSTHSRLAPSPTPSSSSSQRPLGYMYAPAKSMRRTPSCKSCGGSPAPSLASTRTLTPGPPLPGKGAIYAYDYLTPSPGALPYSGFGHMQTDLTKHTVSFPDAPMAQHLF